MKSSKRRKSVLFKKGKRNLTYEIDFDTLKLFPSKVLGKGAYGIVCRGEWIDADRKRVEVAVKKMHFIRGEPVFNESMRNSIVKEAITLFSLEHPNLLKAYGLATNGGKEREFYLVTEVMEGGDLLEYLENVCDGKASPMATEEKLRLSIQLAEVISYLQEKKYVHRDIRPKNILLELCEGPNRTLQRSTKLCDLGLTRENTIYTNLAIGVADFLAPECKGKGKPLFASDVYSFGMVLWCMFMNNLPYRLGRFDSMFPETVSDPVTEQLLALVRRCCQKTPDDRCSIQTALKILQELYRPFIENDNTPILISQMDEHAIKYVKMETETEKQINDTLQDLLKEKDFNDFLILKRLGVTRSLSGKRMFHGVNSAVFMCTLRESGIVFAMKILLNFQQEKETNHIRNRMVLRSFVGDVNFRKLPDFDGDSYMDSGLEKTGILIFPYYPMNLKEYAKARNFKFSISEYLLIAKQLLEAICFLHSHKIVHRDIKPDNIMMNTRGRLMVGDLGCVLNCNGMDGFSCFIPRVVLNSFMRGGAVHYMPPEIRTFVGDSNMNFEKYDVFSLGIVLHDIVKKDQPVFIDQKLTIENYFPLPSEYPSAIQEYVKGMCAPEMEKRNSCYEALSLCIKLLDEESKKYN